VIDSNKIPRDFPHLQSGQIYFNHASCAPMNRSVKIALEELIRKKTNDAVNDYPGLVNIASETKQLISGLINCTTDRIAFTDNTTNGLNILAQGIDWQKGDRVLLNDAEFPANVYPFLNLIRKGVEVDFVKSNNGIVTAEDILGSIKSGCRLISVSQVQFLSGYRIDLEMIGNYCRQNDIIFSVDGAQGLGAVILDVEKFCIDFLSCGSQKWLLGLEGLAFIFINKKLQDRINVPMAGWLGVKDAWNLLDYNLEFRESASRFQPGTINTIGTYALHASLTMLKKYGNKQIEDSVLNNSEHFINNLNQIGINPVLNNIDKNNIAGIVSFKAKEGEKLFNLLNDKNIICTFRADHLRFSPHFYNSIDEIDKVVGELKKNINLV
jgi:selenocysteine lyase/cysteine desulfurase